MPARLLAPLALGSVVLVGLASLASCVIPRALVPPPRAPWVPPEPSASPAPPRLTGVAPASSAAAPLPLEAGPALEGRSFSVELHVDEPAGVERRSEPVLASLPFPREAQVRDGSELTVLTEAGIPLPVQAHVLSRWDGRPDDRDRPARWILLAFEADVGAHRTRPLHVVKRALDLAPAKPVQVEAHERSATLDTGAVRVELGGASLVGRIVAGSGEPIVSGGAATLRTGDGSTVARALPPESCEVLEPGPVRGVVRLAGHYAAGPGSPALGYALTVEGWAGRSELRLSLATRNSDPHRRGCVQLSELAFGLDLSKPAESTDSPEGARPLASGDALVLEQGPRAKGGAPSFTVGLEGGARAGEGREHEGWLAAGAGDSTVGLALERPVARAPSGIRVARDSVSLRFCRPGHEGTEDPIWQRWLGDLQQRTDGALLFFGKGEPSALVRAWRSPLLGQPNASWVRDAGGFLGPIADATDEAQALGACALEPDPHAARSPSASRPPAARALPFVGEVNVKWDTESDEARDLLVRWVRTGDRAAFDEAAAWVDFGRDRYAPRMHGFDFATAEMRPPSSDTGAAVEAEKRLSVSRLKESHVYGEGLVGHYLLTGDRASLEAAEDVAKLAADRFSRLAPTDPIVEMRVFARPMQVLAALVEVTGDATTRALLERMVACAAASRTRDLGRGCYAFKLYVGEFDLDALLPAGLSLPERFPGDAARGLFARGPRWIRIKGERAAFPYQDRELAHALARAFEVTGDERARQALLGLASFYLDEGLVPVFHEPDLAITPYYVLPYVPEPEVARYRQPSAPLYSTNLGLIEAAAWLESGDPRFLDLAKRCLRIACLRGHGDLRPLGRDERKIRLAPGIQWAHGWDDVRTFVALGAKGARPRPAAVRSLSARAGAKPGTVELRFLAGDEKAVRWIVLGSPLAIVPGKGDGEKTVAVNGATPLAREPARGKSALLVVTAPAGERSFVVLAEGESGALSEPSNVASLDGS